MTNIKLDSSEMVKQMGIIDQGQSIAHVTFDKSFYQENEVAGI
jgi:hypothetical protein